MICPGCGHESRPGAKFCGFCGAAVERACPACCAPVGKGERFCTECGTPVASSAPSLASAVAVSGEKKHISVLFADIAGSVDLQEQLDAEVRAQDPGPVGRHPGRGVPEVRQDAGQVFTGVRGHRALRIPAAQKDYARRQTG